MPPYVEQWIQEWNEWLDCLNREYAIQYEKDAIADAMGGE